MQINAEPIQLTQEIIAQLKDKRQTIVLMCGALATLLQDIFPLGRGLQTADIFICNLQKMLLSNIDPILDLAARPQPPADPGAVIAQLDETRRKRDVLKGTMENFSRLRIREAEAGSPDQSLADIYKLTIEEMLQRTEMAVKNLEAQVDALCPPETPTQESQ